MERTERLPAATRSLSVPSFDFGAVATWLLGAGLVVYLALRNGGYDPVPRDQIGVLIWWVLLCGAAVGVLPVPARSRMMLVPLGLLAGFAAWTALSLGWTESSERTANELARVLSYLGIFVLALSLVIQRRDRARQLLFGVTLGAAVVVGLAVLSRLHMAWFPENQLGKVLTGIEIERRLSYPLNYSSALGAFAGITIPLLLAATASARTIVVQAIAAAAIPLAGLALYLSTSGTGAAVTAVAILAFFIIAPDRLPKLTIFALGAAGAAILSAAVDHRAALDRGLPTSAAEHQGSEVLVIALFVCVGVGLVQAGLSLAVRYGRRPHWLVFDRAKSWLAIGAVAAVAIPVAIGADLPGRVHHQWEVFKSRDGGSPAGASSSSGIFNLSGSGRYQFWRSAIKASEKGDSWTGRGPGTFEFWWARHGSYAGFVRDAHSVYFENLAELGIIGFLLITGFVLGIVGIGVSRTLRSPPERRLVLAAATAGCAGFAFAATLDWVWEMAAIAAVFLLCAAVAVGGYPPSRRRADRRIRRQRRRQETIGRGVVVAVSIAALVAIWFPLTGASDLLNSQIAAADGDLPAALKDAQDAADAQPYAASPRLQEALILEQQGKLEAAAGAAREATQKESTNWRTWLTRSRIDAERGQVGASIHDYRRARSLNPKSGLLKP